MTTRSQQPGLHTRLGIERLRIASQHRRLGVLFHEVVEALDCGDREGLHDLFHTFADGLRAHFDVEERVQIPALHGAKPDLEEQLQALVRAHYEFRERLGRIADSLAGGHIEHFESELLDLGTLLSHHEDLEEALFARG
jgi:hypothetical protein